jgi:hypothetical protein
MREVPLFPRIQGLWWCGETYSPRIWEKECDCHVAV